MQLNNKFDQMYEVTLKQKTCINFLSGPLGSTDHPTLSFTYNN